MTTDPEETRDPSEDEEYEDEGEFPEGMPLIHVVARRDVP
jgi:hypothetical protein